MLNKVCARRRLTRLEERDLEIEIRFMEGIIRRDPRFVEALQVLGSDYTRRGDLSNSLRVVEQLARLRPRDPVTLYNLACSCSLNRQLRRAADALSLAIDLGYRDFRLLLRDPDLTNLRRHAVFKRVQEKMRSAKIKIH